jgi:hypothetical protein
MDRLQAMTTFVAVVDSGAFASAARKLQAGARRRKCAASSNWR